MTKQELRLNEVREALALRPKPQRFRAKILFDGKQYTIRIPAEFAHKAVINPGKDEFEFELRVPDDPAHLPQLRGDLVERDTE